MPPFSTPQKSGKKFPLAADRGREASRDANRKGGNELVSESLFGCTLDLCHRRPRLAPLDVLLDGAGEKHRFLARHATRQAKQVVGGSANPGRSETFRTLQGNGQFVYGLFV